MHIDKKQIERLLELKTLELKILLSRDVKASRPMWPQGQIIRPQPRPHSFWPRPHAQLASLTSLLLSITFR